MTVTTKKGRQHLQPGCYDLATGKTAMPWNVTASKIYVEIVETETEALVVQSYYDIFNIADLSEIALLAMHHMQSTEFANIGAGVVADSKTQKSSK